MHSLAQRVANTNMLLAREIEAEFQRLENITRSVQAALQRFAHRTGCPPGGDVVEWLNQYEVKQ